MTHPQRRRPRQRLGRVVAIAGLAFLLVFPLLASIPLARPVSGAGAGMGNLVIFLRPAPNRVRVPGPPTTIRLAALEVVSATGEILPLSLEPLEMRSDAGGRAGAILARASLPPGPYRALRFTRQAPPGGTAPEPLTFEVEAPFRIQPGAATSLFLYWDATATPAGGVPALTARLEESQLRSLLIFVTNQKSDDVTVIQRDLDQVVGVVDVGRGPVGIDTDAAGLKVYVANSGSDSISIVDSLTRRVLDTVRLDAGARPVDLAVSPDGRRLFVVQAGRASLLALDTSSLQQAGEVDLGLGPERVVITPDGATVYVSNRLSNSITVLDARTLLVRATVPVAPRPRDMAVDPRDGRVLLGFETSEGVAVLGPGAAVDETLNFGAAIGALALDREGVRLYLSAHSLDRLLFAQARGDTVTGMVPLRAPGRLAVDPDGKKIYVLDPEGDAMQVVNRILARVEGSIPTGSRPTDLVLLP